MPGSLVSPRELRKRTVPALTSKEAARRSHPCADPDARSAGGGIGCQAAFHQHLGAFLEILVARPLPVLPQAETRNQMVSLTSLAVVIGVLPVGGNREGSVRPGRQGV